MNNILKKFNLSPRAIILAIVFSVAFFLLGAQKFKTYRSDVTILVIPKSELAAKQKDQLLDNIIKIPKSLAFYDRLLQDNPSFVDTSAEETAEKRKQIWNEMISIERADKASSTILFSVLTKDEAGADVIASKTVRTIFDVTSAYYNIKDDVDLRIIDGPITKTAPTKWPSILFFSVLLGSLLTFLMESIIKMEKKTSSLPDIFKNNPLRNFVQKNETVEALPIETLENLYAAENIQETFDKNKQLEKEPQIENKPIPQEIKHLQEIASRGVYPNFPEMPVHNIGEKATAPANLPIGDFDLNSDFETENISEIANEKEIEPELSEEEEAIATEKIHEPTAEQLKERLNQLLKGEI